MKNITALLTAFLLVLSVSGQALAVFNNGDLIRIVYGSGVEYITDLGNFLSLTGPSSANSVLNADKIDFTKFEGATMDKLYVAYFIYTRGKFGSERFMPAGLSGGAVGNSATIASDDPNSYESRMGMNGTTNQFPDVGTAYAGTRSDQNLAPLSAAGYVDQYIYDYADHNNSGTGVAVALIRTYADGHTVLNPPAACTVRLNIAGTVSVGGSVTITSSTGGLNCTWNGSDMGGTCATSGIIGGTPVTLTASLPPGTTIDWGNGCNVSTETACIITSLENSFTLSPVTAAQTFSVTVSGAGANGGTMAGGAI